MRRRQASDEHILTYIALNPAVTRRDLLRKFGGSNNHLNDLLQRVRSARDYEKKAQEYPVPTDDLAVVKKVGEVDWREWFAQAKTTQELASKASFSQDFAIIDIQRQFGITGPVVIWHISDLHMGSLATNYDALEEITQGILDTPNLLVVLNGDLAELTATFKNALAVHSQAWSIEIQHAVLESWLDTIAPKVLSAGWDNHGVEREEKWGAFSHIKQLLNRRFVYHNGMGRLTLKHGAAVYELLISHKISGVSIYNRLNGLKRLMRLEFGNVDIGMTGDFHTPAIETYFDGEMKKVAMMGGNLKVNDGYQKRYYTLFTHMAQPAVVLWPDQKFFAGYLTADEALAVAKHGSIPKW